VIIGFPAPKADPMLKYFLDEVQKSSQTMAASCSFREPFRDASFLYGRREWGAKCKAVKSHATDPFEVVEDRSLDHLVPRQSGDTSTGRLRPMRLPGISRAAASSG
jgi:hypothetical protein